MLGPIDPATQRILLKIVGFLIWKHLQVKFFSFSYLKKCLFYY